MSVVEYVKDLYKSFAKDFDIYLKGVRDDVEDCDEEAVKLYGERYAVFDDPVVPQWLQDIVYWGEVYKYFTTLAPPRVVERDEKKKKRPEINYDSLTTYVIQRYCIISYNKIIYIYTDNRFREEKGEIGKLIERLLVTQGIADKRRIRDTVAEVTARILWRTFFREFPFNYLGREFVPLENGVLWREENRLLIHSPVFAYTYCLPVKYNPDARCPKIDKFLSELVDEKNVPILYEIPASCLLQDSRYQHAYMLVGSGSNGKSTYLKVIEKLLGRENISAVSLQELCTDRFKAAQVIGKLANIHADIPKKAIRDTGRFKILTGGDRITVERKYKDPFEYESTARLIFSANELPDINDKTYAFWRRWVVVTFPNTFTENPNLLEELTTGEELSGFLNKVLLALTRIEIRGITRTDVVRNTMEKWMRSANPVYGFVKDCIERDPQGVETKDNVYSAYVKYCEENDLNADPKNVFGTELQKYVVGLKRSQRRIEGKKVTVWVGIRLKCEESGGESKSQQSQTLDSWDLDDMLED